jgi:integrase
MAKDKTTGNLQQRGHQYYLKVAIPPSLRRFFLSSTGKPQDQIQQPLKDASGRGLSYEEARVVLPRRVAKVRELFDRLRREPTMTPEQVKAALRGPEDMSQDELDRAINESFGGSQATDEYIRKRNAAIRAAIFEAMGSVPPPGLEQPAPTPAGETISQAAEAWYPEIERAKPRASTLKGLRDHVRAFVEKCGDRPLTEVTRAMASDFLSLLDVSTQTRNTYALTLKRVFKCAARRGRFSKLGEDNPFHDQRLKVTKGERVERDRFTIEEIKTLLDALPCEIAPKKHTPQTAVGWAARIALYMGTGLEETCQLTVDDIREETVNGGTLVCINIHNGDDGHILKNDESRPRLLPMHSALVRLGLLEYVANVRKEGHKQLFPGLTRRASKDNKIGPRVGELFNKKRRALGIKREGMKLDFHSFRHTVSNTLEIAGVSQTDTARVLGHAVEGMSYGNYSQGGPGLKRVAGIVETIVYDAAEGRGIAAAS